jgi:hypothetical protein
VSEYVSTYYPTILHPYHRARTFFCPPRYGRCSVFVLTYATTFLFPQRTLPEGLSKRDRKVLQKIKSRAHYLDKGMNLCGLRVGWTFWIVSQAIFQKDPIYICRPQDDEFLNRQLAFSTSGSFQGIIPGAGDVVNAILNYLLVIRLAKRAEIPGWLLHQMLLNNAVSAGVGVVPLVGDLVVAVYKANSRNAHLWVFCDGP